MLVDFGTGKNQSEVDRVDPRIPTRIRSRVDDLLLGGLLLQDENRKGDREAIDVEEGKKIQGTLPVEAVLLNRSVRGVGMVQKIRTGSVEELLRGSDMADSPVDDHKNQVALP